MMIVRFFCFRACVVVVDVAVVLMILLIWFIIHRCQFREWKQHTCGINTLAPTHTWGRRSCNSKINTRTLTKRSMAWRISQCDRYAKQNKNEIKLMLRMMIRRWSRTIVLCRASDKMAYARSCTRSHTTQVHKTVDTMFIRGELHKNNRWCSGHKKWIIYFYFNWKP